MLLDVKGDLVGRGSEGWGWAGLQCIMHALASITPVHSVILLPGAHY
jgi:hypothetical protein